MKYFTSVHLLQVEAIDKEIKMYQKEIEKQVQDMKEFTKEICKDKKRAKQFLIDAGIFNEDGTLAEEYK